jgi:hypothetical protein
MLQLAIRAKLGHAFPPLAPPPAERVNSDPSLALFSFSASYSVPPRLRVKTQPALPNAPPIPGKIKP